VGLDTEEVPVTIESCEQQSGIFAGLRVAPQAATPERRWRRPQVERALAESVARKEQRRLVAEFEAAVAKGHAF
jgi:hypothetical protein